LFMVSSPFVGVSLRLITANGAPIGRIEDQDYGPSAKFEEGHFSIRGG
jgi:hypothetical protein